MNQANPDVEAIVEVREGIRLCYERRGVGEPLLLVMGLGAQLVLWPEGFVDALVERGFSVIRFDNRDIGKSTWMKGVRVGSPARLLAARLLGLPVRVPYTLDDMTDDVAGLLDALHLPSAHVLGISMGGMIAQNVAIRHPHRVRTLTSVSSTTGSRRHFFAKPRALRALLGPRPARNREEAIATAIRVFTAIGTPPLDRDQLAEMAGRSWDRGSNPPGFLRQLAAICGSASRLPGLRRLRVPTLVVHGTADPLIHCVGGRATAAAVPGARLHLLEGMGHDLPPSRWDEITDSVAAHAGAGWPDASSGGDP